VAGPRAAGGRHDRAALLGGAGRAQPSLPWISPGSALAVALWLVLSTGFAAYIANFASYNKTYGTVAGVIVFLLWLWLSNLAILVGLEFDRELVRERGSADGSP